MVSVIRPLTAADAPQLLAINGASLPGVSLLSMETLEHARKHAPYCRVLERSGSIRAYLIVYAHDSRYEGEEFAWFRSKYREFLYIDQVAVASHARREGFATLLYRNLERYARDHKIRTLTCEVNLRPPNAASLAFHNKGRYLEVGTLHTRDNRQVSLRAKSLFFHELISRKGQEPR